MSTPESGPTPSPDVTPAPAAAADGSGGSAPPPASGGRLMRVLDRVERIGNALPAPVTIFFIFSVLVLFASWIAARTGVTAEHPGTGATLTAVNLLSHDGLYRILTEAVSNFTSFAPLGTVLVVMSGIGIAERSGLISTGLRQLMAWVPKSLVTATLVFAGIMSSMAADAGYVVLTPLGAVLFAGMGRHPIAGLAAAFAGVSAGYSANLFITGLDPLLAGFTQEAAQMREASYEVHAASNWYFMMVSVPVMTLVGTWVTTRLVEPRLGPWSPSDGDGAGEVPGAVTPRERKALFGAGVAAVLCTGLVLLTVLPERGVLRSGTIDVTFTEEAGLETALGVMAATGDEVEARTVQVAYDARAEVGDVVPVTAIVEDLENLLGEAVDVAPPAEGAGVLRASAFVIAGPGATATLRLSRNGEPEALTIEDPRKAIHSGSLRGMAGVERASRSPGPFYGNMVPLLMLLFFVPGLVYGLMAGTVKDDKAVEKMTGDTMATMGAYIVLAFVAAQFVAYFSWSNLGLIMAVKGAEFLNWIGIGGLPLILGFVFVSAMLNIFIGSASAKWGIMAPVFVPMLMQMGYSPETVQVAYRVGDSVTNIITPLLPYFPIIIAFAQKYDRKSGLGTLISAMLPYSIAFGLAWTVMLVVWVSLGVPLGPDAPLFYDPMK
jgi:aminobenzoyl-glutamate transport protein